MVQKKNKSALQSAKKNKSATNPITCGRVNPDIFESDDVKSVSSLSPNNKPIWRNSVGRTEQISRHYLALRRMLWRHFSAEESWVLE